MIFTATPIVQFKKAADFLADVGSGGRVVGVWHECVRSSGFVAARYQTIIRALVVDAEGVTPILARIASFVYTHPVLADENGRVTDGERLRRHAQHEHDSVTGDVRGRLMAMGIPAGKFRPGLLSMPSTFQYLDTEQYDYRWAE